MTAPLPAALLKAAAGLLSGTAGAPPAWPRVAAILCRQALELSLAEFWRARVPDLQHVSMRAQLICLPSYLNDPALARRLSVTWSSLSNACHHHAYELAPTSAELNRWIESVKELHASLAKSVRRPPRSP